MKDQDDHELYKFGKDVPQVLHQIVSDLKQEYNLQNKHGLKMQHMKWCSMRLAGNVLELRVQAMRGNVTKNHLDQKTLVAFCAELRKLLEKFEKAVREEFKERTGKPLRWSRLKVYSDYEAVALNNLYRVFAFKTGPLSTELDGQEWEPESDVQIEPGTEWGHGIVDLKKI